jgi:hypothetical protein
LFETTTALAELLTKPTNKENKSAKLIVAKTGNLLDLPLDRPEIDAESLSRVRARGAGKCAVDLVLSADFSERNPLGWNSSLGSTNPRSNRFSDLANLFISIPYTWACSVVNVDFLPLL